MTKDLTFNLIGLNYLI